MYSIQTAVSDGSLTMLPLSIEYDSRDLIHVYFDGVEDARQWAWVGATDKAISFSPAVENGVVVRVQRITPLDNVPNIFGSASPPYVGYAEFDADTVDENFRQTLQVAQESTDRTDEAIIRSNEAVGIAESAVATADQALDAISVAVVAANQAVDIANTALDVAEGIDAKAQEALDTANAAESVALGIDAKAQTALDNSNAAVTVAAGATSTANDAKDVAEGIDAKAQEALDTANAAELIASGAASLRPELAQPDGAALVGFKQEGVGAVEQSVRDVLKSFVLIESFGAKFDGVTNDTQAWVDATNFCRENSKDLRLPAGVSIVDPDVIDISGVNLYGVARGYFNRQGSIVESTSRTGVLLDQKSYGASRITTHWEGILFRKCNIPARWGYLVNSSFHKVFAEDCDDTFHFGRPDALGTLWCRWSECQTNVQGRGFVISGQDMANNNLFVNCMFRGGEPSLLTATSGYGAISNTFINTEFRHSVGNDSGGLELGRTENTTFVNPYFESNGPSIIASVLNRNVKLINPVFSITRSDDPENDPPAYIVHESGTFTLSIDGGRIYANDVESQKGLSLVRSKSTTTKPYVTVISPTSVLVSGGTQESLGFTMFKDVPYENIRGSHTEEVITTRDGIEHRQILSWRGRSVRISGRSVVAEENASTASLIIPIPLLASTAHGITSIGFGRILYGSGVRRFVQTSVTGNHSNLQFTREVDGSFVSIQFNHLSVGTVIIYAIDLPL